MTLWNLISINIYTDFVWQMSNLDNLEKVILMNKLLNIYGELLTDTQKEILSDYYEFNLSISEISENRKISRAAVEDALKKGSKKIENFEKSLQISAKNEKVLVLLNQLQNESDPNLRAQLVDEIRKVIE